MTGQRLQRFRELQVTRFSRSLYELTKEQYSERGNLILSDLHKAQLLTMRLNENRDLPGEEEEPAKTGDLLGIVLMEEIFHHVITLYDDHLAKDLFEDLYSSLHVKRGKILQILRHYTNEFPPPPVFEGKDIPETYFKKHSRKRRGFLLEEIILTYMVNENPASAPYRSIFDDRKLRKEPDYLKTLEDIQDYFAEQPTLGREKLNLFDMLLEPSKLYPDSIRKQLDYIRENWADILGPYLLQILKTLDLIKEEYKIGLHGPGTIHVPDYTGLDEEYEAFSKDLDWMPHVVLMAKSIFVWLDQLSKKYARPIAQLNQIPNEELDLLQEQGFTALWLIGLWKRSSASKQIKQSCGNPEAESSAYSLFDYNISSDLGGWSALENLRKRCWERGIRMASDMVPNHTGIDSAWIHERPDWFVQSDVPPFPSYQYNSQNLSSNPGIGVYIEDHYYDRTDAAVTFKHVDFLSGLTRYIYHGNDGTSMPWNDTAQLDFLNPELRETVIQTIVQVAKNFPIIRFDAAMTLAKRHIQRLWYPEPGTGGAIPSRSGFSLSRKQFNQKIPEEFWREVVDRVAREVPDTLLLAEAFWMMEGYFVRTLGMHRVYNSAFMHMLKQEDNQKYRTTIRNTLHFDPQVLKRFVNFMNNPDEETAAEQFGKGDKYFGICTLMVTMPGLPMFGHGQIEGYYEKYGMEYRRAYREEYPDMELIRRHQHEIFPLLKKRYLFAEVGNFRFYDFIQGDGGTNEDVYAYTNSLGEEYALILYNNRYERAAGWINHSIPYAGKNDNGDKVVTTSPLGRGLNLTPGNLLVFQEQRSGLWFIRSTEEILSQGMYAELQGFQNQVFLNFHQISSGDRFYRELMLSLEGKGILDITKAIRDLKYQSVRASLTPLLNTESFNEYRKLFLDASGDLKPFLLQTTLCYEAFLNELASLKNITSYTDEGVKRIKTYLQNSLVLLKEQDPHALRYIKLGMKMHPAVPETLFLIGLILPVVGYFQKGGEFEEYLLDSLFRESLVEAGSGKEAASGIIELLRVLTVVFSPQGWDPDSIMEKAFDEETGQRYLGVNLYQDILWFSKEPFHDLIWWLFLIARSLNEKGAFGEIKHWIAAEEASSYKVNNLLELLRETKG